MTPELYCDVFEQLERENVRYCTIGGVAVVLHGYVRTIADLDIAIDPDPTESQRAMNALTQAGFVPSIPVPISFLTVLRMFDRRQRELDVFMRPPVPFKELWADSQLVRVDQTQARICSLEHLVRAKRFNGRPEDLKDSAGLLQVMSCSETTPPNNEEQPATGKETRSPND